MFVHKFTLHRVLQMKYKNKNTFYAFNVYVIKYLSTHILHGTEGEKRKATERQGKKREKR